MPPTPNRKRKSASAAVTPKSNGSGSGSASANSTPAKKRASRGKGKSDTVINLDVDDPFSFDSKSDTHPEPLKNISVERTAFGGMKFSRSPPSSSERYASLEKIAERRGNISGLSSSATRPSPLSVKVALQSSSSASRSSTPKNKGKKRVLINQSSSEYQMDEEEDKDSANESSKGKSAPGTPAAPGSVQSSAKRRSKSSAFAEAAASIYGQKKTNEEDLYKVPELNPIEQLEVDHATQEHQLLAPGARVLALWGSEFYAAYVCGRDGLSRYLVHFVEDNLNRLLPPTGVIPLAMLSTGYEISFIWPVDDEEIGKVGVILAAPSGDDAEEWVEGIFEVREANTKEVRRVSWEKVYLSKDQRAKINVSAVNSTVFVDRENIVNESRSSRRSRTTRFSNESLSTVTGNVATPQQGSASRPTRASKTPKTPKTPVIPQDDKNETAATETSEEVPIQTPQSAGSRRGRSAGRKPSPPKAVTPASTRSTPRRKANQKTQEKVQPEGGEKEDEGMEELDPIHEEVMADERTEEKPTSQPTTQPSGVKQEPDKQKQEGAGELAIETMAMETSMEEQSTPPKEQSTSPEEQQQEEAMEVAGEELNKHKQSTHEVPDVNGNEAAPELSFNIEQLNGSGSGEEGEAKKDILATTVIHNMSNGSTSTKQQHAAGMTAMEFLAANDGPMAEEVVLAATTVTSTTSEENVVPLPVAPADEKPAATAAVPLQPVNTTMFENMKFVLTSATRSKKTSDFNKRDYRAKIEERGGQMIEDFSDLKEGDKAFLIADTYYRTHKYLSALSLSVPCVKHNWIQECVNQEQLVDHLPFMLPAGESTLDSTKIYDWKPLKGYLLRDKRVWVYSNLDNKGNDRVLGFVDIWSSIIRNLGAELVEGMPQGIMDKLERCRENPVSILLSDVTCEKAIAERVEAEGGIAISSEWVIQAIVTGELPDVNASDRFRFDSAP